MDFDPGTHISRLTDKVIFVTGGTSGLGAASIRALASHDPAHIYFTGRNAAAATSLISDIQKTSPSASLTFIEMDQSSLVSVKAASSKFVHDRLDILMCNAGIMEAPPALSADGYEIHFATNHLGHAMLICQLMPVLLKTAKLPDADVRIVTLTSTGWSFHPKGGIAFSKLEKKNDGLLAKSYQYGQSKLANLIYAAELARHFPSIISVSVHPGVVETRMFANLKPITRRIISIHNWFRGVSQVQEEQGIFNQIWAAAGAKKYELVNGGYYEPVGMLCNDKLTDLARDKDLARRLWGWTESALDKIEWP